MNETIIVPENTELSIRTNNLHEEAMRIRIVNVDTYRLAADFLLSVKAIENEIKSFFRPFKSSAYQTWKSICSAESNELKKLDPISLYLNSEMTRFNLEQEGKRRKEEERIRIELEKQAEEERIKAAVDAEKTGDKELAETILNESPVTVIAPVLPKTIPKINGLALKTYYRAEVIDLKALVMAIAAGKVPIEAIEPNMTFLNNQARVMKGNLNYPGVRIVSEKSISGVRR